MKIRVEIEITDVQLRSLAYAARGYCRENPRNMWKIVATELKDESNAANQH